MSEIVKDDRNLGVSLLEGQDKFIAVLERALFATDMPTERIAAIYDMVERARADDNKRQFTAAVVKAQSMMPKILKTNYNSQTRSNHETLEDILDAIKPILTACGLSVMCGECEDSPDGTVRIFYEITHVSGPYSKILYYTCPLDDAGLKGNINKTPIQARGSSVSYGRRYLHKMAWDLATGDDNDGQRIVAQSNYNPITISNEAPSVISYPISATQKANLLHLIEQAESKIDVLYRRYNVACVDDMTQAQYENACEGLTKKIDSMKTVDAQIVSAQPENFLNV